MLHTNGNPVAKQLPAVAIGWDAENQKIQLQFDNKQFKTWDMLIAVFELAKLEAQSQRQIALMANLQRQQVEAAQAEAVRRQVMRG